MGDLGVALALVLTSIVTGVILRAWWKIVREFEQGKRSFPPRRNLRTVFVAALVILAGLAASAVYLASIEPLALWIPVLLAIALIGVVGSLYLATRD